MSDEKTTAPVAPVHPVKREFHGREFVDNYEWMRDKQSQETLDYLNAENDYTAAHTGHLDAMTENIFQEIKSRIKQTDMSVQAQVLELLARLIEDRGLTLLFVTHDLSVVRGLCDRVGVLNRGELVEHGPTERVWPKPESDSPRRLIAAAGQ